MDHAGGREELRKNVAVMKHSGVRRAIQGRRRLGSGGVRGMFLSLEKVRYITHLFTLARLNLF